MTAALIDLENGTIPATPAAGHVRIYAKTDKKVYAQDDTAVEVQLTGQIIAGILGKSDGTTLGNTAGISGIVRNSVGNYSVTLATAISVSSYGFPVASILGTSARFIAVDLATALPCTQVNVYTFDNTGVAVDSNFSLTIGR